MSTSTPDAVRGLCGTLLILGTLATGLRVYSRRVQSASMGSDDWTIILAWLFFLAQIICVLLGVQWNLIGINYNAADRGLQERVYWAMDVTGTTSEGFTRISAILFLRRIFCVSGRSRSLHYITSVGIVIVSLWTVTFIVLPLLQCGTNLDYLTASTEIATQRCAQGIGPQYVLAYTISNVILEVLIIALPLPLISKLQLSLRKRIALGFVFSTALLSVAVGCARLQAAVASESLTGTALRIDTTNLTFFWVFGVGTALVAANLPSLFWVVKKLKPESVLSAVRSVISLQSIRSNRSGQIRRDTSRTGTQRNQPEHKASDGSLNPLHTIQKTTTWETKTEDSTIEV